MPLAIENGTVLVPDVDGPPPETHLLEVRHFPQEGKLWCWAACVQMVLEYYQRTKPESGIQSKTQCDITKELAKIENKPIEACPEDPQLKLASCDPDLMKAVWVRCNLKEELQDRKAVLKMEHIKEQIANGKPIQVGIRWDLAHGGGGHAVLIKGWVGTNPEALVIDDPLRDSSFGLHDPFLAGSGRATHAELKAALGHGQWFRTWFDLA
jgi:hypothetical protein